jgi:hypothetical protein
MRKLIFAARGVGAGVFLLACSTSAFSRDASQVAVAREMTATQRQMSPQARANFLGETASEESRTVADRVVASGDNGGLPFVIVDKIMAKAFVFDSAGDFLGAAPVLLGMARGDDSVPGIGIRKLSAMLPEERTTPAGRFVASLGRDLKQDILWIDYKDSISMHRVITGNPGDHRLARLATASPLDNRISYGCINVPVKFYEQVVLKTFTGTSGIVYILPEIKTIQDAFPTLVKTDGRAGND